MISCSRAHQRPELSVASPSSWHPDAPDRSAPGLRRSPGLMDLLLDAIADGLILADATARVIHANHGARELLKAGPLTIRYEQLCAQAGGETQVLRDLIRACARGSLDTATFIASGSRSPDNVLLLMTAAEAPGEPGRGVIILARPLGPKGLPTPAVVGSVFGLTPAEARFAIELMNGDGLKPCARRLNVTLSTVRTHLKHVFEKTGAKRQAELIRLLLSCRFNGHPPRSAR